MYWVASGFIFRQTTSKYNSIDPRVKLLISLLLFTVSLLVRSIPEMGGVIAFMLVLSIIANAARRVAKTIAFTALFALVVFAINMFFTRDLISSSLYALRFIAIVLATSLFFLTTTPDELELVMKSFHLPRDIIFAFVTAVRFIPVMMLDAIQIMDAQKSRGLELQKGNIVKRVKNMIPILIPLVVNSVVRSGELAEAMEARAYGAVQKPTSLYANRARLSDMLIAALSVVCFAFAVYSFYYVIPVWPP